MLRTQPSVGLNETILNSVLGIHTTKEIQYLNYSYQFGDIYLSVDTNLYKIVNVIRPNGDHRFTNQGKEAFSLNPVEYAPTS